MLLVTSARYVPNRKSPTTQTRNGVSAPENASSGQSIKLGNVARKLALLRYSKGTVLCPIGRRVEVRWVHKDQELRSCHILFVSRSESKRYARVLQVVQGADVLTVGETPDFLSTGGALSFTFENEVLQFEVNLVAANDAHLRVSSRLLALARRVVNNPEASKS